MEEEIIVSGNGVLEGEVRVSGAKNSALKLIAAAILGRGKTVLHNGRTMHFLSRDNTYAYFRYDDTDAVFVFINNSRGKKQVPWSHYAEIATGLHDGRNVLTGEAAEVSDATVVGPRQALVVEFKR